MIGSLLTAFGNLGVKILWFSAILAMLLVGIQFLPNGADYPFPTQASSAIISLYSWLYSLNALIPVATAAKIFTFMVIIDITVQLVWRLVMWVIKVVTGGGE